MANPNRGIAGAGAYFANAHDTVPIQTPTDFGYDANGVDVQFYSSTAGAKFWWDESARTVYAGADTKWVDMKLFGSTTGAYALWDGSANTLFITKAKLTASAKTDVTLRGSATGAYVIWDASANSLIATGKAKMVLRGSTTAANVSWVPASNSLVATGKADVVLRGSTTAANITWDASANTLIATGRAKVTLRSSASLIEFVPASNSLDLNLVGLSCNNVNTAAVPNWHLVLVKTGTNLYAKVNCTSLSTAVYRYIKLNATSVVA